MATKTALETEPYHHGDLANACVDAALALLNERGLGSVTLREVARRIQASRSAPYRHFVDKRDLLAACARQGFVELTRRVEPALAGVEGPDADTLRGVLHQYARFGVERPHLYRLMFASDFTSEEFPDLAADAERGFAIIRDAIVRGQRAGTLAVDDIDGLVLALWSSVHGLVSLCNELPNCSVLDMTALEHNLDRVLNVFAPAWQPPATR